MVNSFAMKNIFFLLLAAIIQFKAIGQSKKKKNTNATRLIMTIIPCPSAMEYQNMRQKEWQASPHLSLEQHWVFTSPIPCDVAANFSYPKMLTTCLKINPIINLQKRETYNCNVPLIIENSCMASPKDFPLKIFRILFIMIIQKFYFLMKVNSCFPFHWLTNV